MVVRKPSHGTSTTLPCSVSLGEKAIEWTRKSSAPQVVADAFEHCFHLAGRADVERHEDRSVELARERLDIFFGLVIEIGDRDLSAERPKCLGAAPGDRLLVCDPDDETLLAVK